MFLIQTLRNDIDSFIFQWHKDENFYLMKNSNSI